jgi:hypothetical protein
VTANAGDGQVDWVLKPQLTYSRAEDGAIVMTTDVHGLFVFGTLASAFSTTTNNPTAWTGLLSFWTNHPDQCVGWTSQLSTDSGRYGGTDATDGAALAQQQGPCSSVRRLVCVEQ